MQEPVLIKFTAAKDGSVDSAFSSTQQGVDELGTSFDSVAARSERLGAAIKSAIGGDSSKGFDNTAKAADALSISLDKVATETKSVGDALGKIDANTANRLLAIENAASGLQSKISGASQELLDLSSATVQTATNFEQLEAKLATVQGSTEKAANTFRFAQDFAAKTPFDVEGVVTATVQLEVYGQRSREVLPRVAALAAGMGKSIQDTSLVVGKALSGSLEGFESLRNEYGITTRELVKFGAETNKAGGILTQTAGQARKAEQALLKIIDLRFGDAIERQSKTTQGVLSNASDAAKNFANDIGKGGAEVVKFGAAFVGGGFDLLRKLPGPLKEVAGAALTVTAGVVALGAAGTGAALGLLSLNTQLAAAAIELPVLAPAAAATGTALTFMGTAATGVGAAVRFMLGPVGLAIAAMGGLAFAFDRAADASEAMGAKIKEESFLFQKRVQETRDLANAIDKLADSEAKRSGARIADVSGPGNQEAQLKRVQEILDKSAASEFFSKLKEAGLDAETVRKAAGSTAEDLEIQKTKLKELEDRKKALAEQEASNAKSIASAKVGRVDNGQGKALDSEINSVKQQIAINEQYQAKLKAVQDQFDKNTTSLDKLGKSAQAANDYIKYADKVGDLKSLNSAYGVVTQQISVAASELKKLNEPSDPQSLLEKLRSGKFAGPENQELREKVLAYLDLIEEQKKREKELQKKGAEDEKAALAELQARLAQQKSIRDVSRKEELANLAEQEALALKIGKEGGEALNQIRARQAQIRKDQIKEEGQAAKQAASEALNAAKTLPTAARASERGTQAAVDAYDTAINRVKAWVAANQELIAKFPELGRQGKSAIQALELGRAQAEVARTNKNFSDLQDTLRDLEADAVSTQDKLDAIARAKELVDNAKAGKKITGEQATEVTGDLDRKQRDLNRTKDQEDIRYRQTKLDLDKQAAEQQLAITETLADGSLQSNDKLLVARERLYQFRLQALELEKQAAIAAGDDKIRVEEEYAAKVKLLEQQKTVDFIAEQKKRFDAEKQRLQDIIDENKTEKSDLKFGISDSASFSSFGGPDDEKRRTAKRAQADLDAISRKELFLQNNPEIAARVAEEDRQRALRAADPTGILNATAKGAPKADAPQSQTTNVTNTVTVNVESRKTRTVPTAADAVREVQKAITLNQYYDPNAGVA